MTAADRAAAHANRVVLYARVSSKDQEKEGFSIGEEAVKGMTETHCAAIDLQGYHLDAPPL